jgi:CRISPR-associated protein Cst2
LHEPARARSVIDAITDLAQVAGNHAHFFYDFAPDTVIFRWTSDPAPRILYPFQLGAEGQLTVPELLRRLRAEDIEAGELVVGGSLTESPDGVELGRLGATMHAGVKAAAEDVKTRLAQGGA